MALAADLRSGIMMPVLKKRGLEVSTITLNAEPHLIQEIGACLSQDERRRANCFARGQDRRRFIATRGSLRHILAERLAIPPSHIEFEYGAMGKPRLSRRMPDRGLHFSASRSEECAVIALSDRRKVGVDVEAVRPVAEADDIAALCFSKSEYESYLTLLPKDRLVGFFRNWTRLEAFSKAAGSGLGSPVPSESGEWTVHTLLPEPGYIGTVVIQKQLERLHEHD
jgi:4'-phosphopantetheinyl transferase